MTQVDQITYQQYLKGEWDQLIKTGKEAKKNGIHFYFLDVRMGIAYYNKKKYRKAIKYLEKAYQKDDKNAVVSEYLYYAYIFGGRYLDAVRIGDDFNLELKLKLGIDQDQFIDVIGVDYKTEFSDDYAVDPELGELNQNVITNNTYIGGSLGNYYGTGNLFWFSFGHLQIDYTQYSYDEGQLAEYKSTEQNQYYFAHYSQIRPGLNFGMALNWLRIKYDGIQYQRLGRGGRIVAVPVTSTLNKFVGFMGFRKDIGNFKIGLSAMAANMQDNIQLMPNVSLTWYPLSNTDLYLFANSTYKMEIVDSEWLNDPVTKTGLGFRLSKLYIEPSYTFGDIYNYAENDGLIVYNDSEKITDRFELMSYIFLSKGRLKLYAKYQSYTKTNYYQLDDVQSEIDYSNQTLTTGILWKF